MTGKELADQLFEAFAQGTPGNDPGLADRMDAEIAKLSTDEMWRFVYVAGTRGSQDTNVRDAVSVTGEKRALPSLREEFAAFNNVIAQHNGYKAAIRAMHAAPKPAEWSPPVE